MRIGVSSLVSLVLAAVVLPAFAVYNQQVVLTGGPEFASAQISFTPADAQTVTVTNKEDDDRRIAYIAFGGNSGSAGTLQVTANGSTQAYTLQATVGGEVIRVNTTTGAVTVDSPAAPRSAATPIGLTIGAFYGLGNMEYDSISSGGVTSTNNGENPLTQSDDNIDVDTYGVELTIPIGECIRWRSVRGCSAR